MPECDVFITNEQLVRKQKDDKDDSMVENPKELMINNVSLKGRLGAKS